MGVSAQLRDLVTSLLNPRPEQRLTVREALKHEWFTGVVEVREKQETPRPVDSTTFAHEGRGRALGIIRGSGVDCKAYKHHRRGSCDHVTWRRLVGAAQEESLDLEDSMRGVMAYVNTRNMLRAAVLVVGVFLNEKQLGRLVQSIEQSQKSTISILRLEQTLMDMEETTCMTHLTVRAAPLLLSETTGLGGRMA